jgi:ubiquitin-conjugating enzyme E2 M
VTINLNLTKEDLQNSITPYNHTKLKFQLNFPDSYPIDPPKLKCLNKIYHPNISYTGGVCLPLVREDWSPTVSLEQIIYGLIFILLYPNGEDALEPEIGDQMKSDYKLY